MKRFRDEKAVNVSFELPKGSENVQMGPSCTEGKMNHVDVFIGSRSVLKPEVITAICGIIKGDRINETIVDWFPEESNTLEIELLILALEQLEFPSNVIVYTQSKNLIRYPLC